jgi:hypothetical protein
VSSKTFTDALYTPPGRQAQLIPAAELLLATGRGDHPYLEGPQRQQVGRLLAAGDISSLLGTVRWVA